MAEWDWILQINLYGVIRGVRAFVPQLRRQQRGWLVNTASVAGLYAHAWDVIPYVTAKFGVAGLTEALALYLRPLGIGVSLLCPGRVETNMADTARVGGTPDIGQWLQAMPLEEPVAPEVPGRLVCDAIEHDRFLDPHAPRRRPAAHRRARQRPRRLRPPPDRAAPDAAEPRLTWRRAGTAGYRPRRTGHDAARRARGASRECTTGPRRRDRRVARRRLGAPRGADRHRRDRRRHRRPARDVPDPRGVSRRPRGRDRAVEGPAAGLAGGLRLAARRPGVPTGAAPVELRVPVARVGRAEPAARAPLDRRLRRARAADDGPPPLPGAHVGQVHGRHELRAADAHRPQPLLAAAPPGAAVVASRDVPVPLGRARRCRADPRRVARRLHGPCPDGAARHAGQRPGAVRRRAGGEGRSRLAAGVPDRRVPPRREPHRAGRVALPHGDRVPRRRAGLDRLHERPVQGRPGRRGRRSSRAARRGSSSCSGSRRRVTPSGTRRCSTRRRCATRSSTSPPGATRGRRRPDPVRPRVRRLSWSRSAAGCA